MKETGCSFEDIRLFRRNRKEQKHVNVDLEFLLFVIVFIIKII